MPSGQHVIGDLIEVEARADLIERRRPCPALIGYCQRRADERGVALLQHSTDLIAPLAADRLAAQADSIHHTTGGEQASSIRERQGDPCDDEDEQQDAEERSAARPLAARWA